MVNRDESIKQWVAEYTEPLYRWACSKMDDHELAEDLVQETFLVAFERYDTYERRGSARTWLTSILKNKIMDHYRRQYRSPVNSRQGNEQDFFGDDGMWHTKMRPESWGDDKHLLDDKLFVNTLNRCLEKLPGQWLAVVRLRYLSEKDGDEVCSELDITAANYWQIVRRAKLNLRQCLEINWFRK